MAVSKAKTFRNIIYTSSGKGITLVCVALTNFIVARNLSPADYGVVGFASIIIGFLSQFSDMGLGNAVIARKELNQQNLQTAFTLKVLLSFAAFGGALLIAPFARHFFDHPATGNVIRILALNFLVSTIGFTPQALLTREMNFRALVIPGVAGAAMQCILAVTLVLHGWSYWAVVIANVGATLTTGIVMHLARRSSFRLRFCRSDAEQFLRFGLPLFGTGVLVFVIFNLDNFLVGSSMGSAQLGYYALAFTWGSFVCGLLSNTVNNVLFPAFSSIQDDPIAIRRWYLKTLDLVAFIAVSANAALLANSHFFLVTFLGKGTGKWLPALASLQILCVYGILRAISEPLFPFLMARGETKKLLQANLVAGVVEVGLLLLALKSGKIEFVALAVLAAYASQAIIYLPFLKRNISLGSLEVMADLWPVLPALTAGCLFAAVLPGWFGNSFLTLAVRGASTASVVALTHGIFTRFRCFREVAQMVSQRYARETPRLAS